MQIFSLNYNVKKNKRRENYYGDSERLYWYVVWVFVGIRA